MTAEELKQKIEFKIERTNDGSIQVQGRFVVTAEYLVEWSVAQSISEAAFKDLESLIKEKIQERIARSIYADQREGLRKAIVELMSVNPMDYAAINAAYSKVIEAARFQASDFPGTPVYR